MPSLDRRFFLKTMLAAAAAPAVNGLTGTHLLAQQQPEPQGAGHGQPDHAGSLRLESRCQQLRLSSHGAALTFQNFIRAGSEWKAATLPSRLITGPSFSFATTRAAERGAGLSLAGTAMGSGLDRRPLQYTWAADIHALTPSDSDSWFRFQVVLHLPAAMRLSEQTEIEPQIIAWLSSTSTLLEGQSNSWRRIVLDQPTKNSLGTSGNDLPALYLLDQNLGVETMMFFDVDDMDWMSNDNLPRFLVYRCSSLTEFEAGGTQRLGVGLIANQALGSTLPAGEVRFTYYLLQRPATQLFTEQEAVARWMAAVLPLFQERLVWPPCATTWMDFAAGTVTDLQEEELAQVSVRGQTGLRAYVKASSQLWTQPSDNFELMAVADVLWPALLYLRLHPSPGFQSLCDKLVASLPGFYHPDTHAISNDFVRPPHERADSWYPFENGLIKYPMIGSLSGSKPVIANFLEALANARKFAEKFHYLFPIYYQVDTFRAEGAGTNYAIGGMYAWASVVAAKLTGEQQYRDEARRAVEVLYKVPASRLFHEPQELAFGALAAAELGMRDEANYLLSEELRMFYWFSDPSQKTHDIRGMPQAAASILYPAFKENVEAILPWTGVIRRGMAPAGLLRFLDQQRRNNFYFFENCSPGLRTGHAPFIPFENLGTLELNGQTGNVGKEIYGAGETLWMYLMFEALGNVDDRELMLLNLDLLDVQDARSFPPRKLNFVLFNPGDKARSAKITIPAARRAQVRLTHDGRALASTLQVAPGEALRLVAEY